MNDTLIYECKLKATLRKTSYEVLDSLTVQIDIRFKGFSNFEFVKLTNEKMFKSYSNSFPEAKFLKLLKQYKNDFDEHLLRNELQVIYSRHRKTYTSSRNIGKLF